MEAKVKAWIAFLAECEAKGFKCNRENNSVFRHYAELYVWNQYTIQVGCQNEGEGVAVELYFDREALAYRNKLVKFSFDNRAEALIVARKMARSLSGDLLAEAFME